VLFPTILVKKRIEHSQAFAHEYPKKGTNELTPRSWTVESHVLKA
jgi:hypothetical protein